MLLQSIVFFAHAQVQDSTTVVTDSATTKPDAAKPPKQKEIKKLEDPLLALSSDLINRLKRMKPNQLLVIDERSVRNEKRVADNGEEYEVTITVRLGFSQDMITGIVREVPLYQSNDIEPYLLHVKIPVKFCCTTPIDTLHTKRHCGKMSELNDFEDNQHCKDWAQQDAAAEAAANTAGFGKPGGSKTSKKKGADVTGQTSATGEEEEGFGKPVPKGKKPTKKGKNTKNKMQEDDSEDETLSDSTNNKSSVDSINTKPKNEKPTKVTEKKKEKKEEGFGKPAPKSKNKKKGKEENIDQDDASEVSADSSANQKPTESTIKKDKQEKVEKKKEDEEEGFGKPIPKSKGKKKGKPDNTKDETIEENKEPANETPADSTALPNKKPSKKKEKKKD